MLLKSFALVLCIDEIATGSTLTVTSSKLASTEPIASFLKALEGAASSTDVTIAFNHQKVNVSSPTFAMEHERCVWLVVRAPFSPFSSCSRAHGPVVLSVDGFHGRPSI